VPDYPSPISLGMIFLKKAELISCRAYIIYSDEAIWHGFNLSWLLYFDSFGFLLLEFESLA
jgi:hypothetical protein